jgi:hypothetical protein
VVSFLEYVSSPEKQRWLLTDVLRTWCDIFLIKGMADDSGSLLYVLQIDVSPQCLIARFEKRSESC